MAKIIPFRGILYNQQKIADMADIVAPPFDVISKEEQQKFHECHRQNIIRLTLGRTREDDSANYNRFTRAANYFNAWLSERILVQDKTPAFYLTAHEFTFENKSITRYGLIAMIRLEPFNRGIVLPHEKTFSGIKSERLELMKACQANFSAIFSMYTDEKNEILDLLKKAASIEPPVMEFTEKNGHCHRLWRITDTTVHRSVSKAMKEKKIFIADGHHRYETALNYRNWLSANNPEFNGSHPANYVMMYLCSMEDPGLVILPAHRLLNEVPPEARASIIQKAENYFDVMTIPYKGPQRTEARSQFISILKSKTSKNCIGIFMKDRPELYLLTLKPGVMEQKFGEELPESLRDIDVTVLTRLIFMEILGFDQERLDNEKLIAYSSIAEEAIDAVAAGKHDIAFILNPTKIEQVRNIAEANLIMPRKATYFYPKVITGQVMNTLNPQIDPLGIL